MVTSYAKWLMRWRWLVIISTFIVVSVIASGARFLEFTNDYRIFFAGENPQLQAFEKMQNTYNKSDSVLMVITPKDGKVFTPQTLESLVWLTEQAWQTPFSTRVDSITNFQHTRAEEDDLVVADLVANPQSLSEKELYQLQQIALSEPLLRKRLISTDASVTGVNITVQIPEKSRTEVPEVAAFVRNLSAELTARDPNLTVRLTGIVMMNTTFGETAQKDMSTLIPLMFVMVLVTLGLLLRRIAPVLVTLLVIVMSIVVGLGVFGWAGMKMSTPVASAPTIILTLAVADAVHIFVVYLWNLRKNLDKHSAMVESLRVNMQPVTLTSLTTIVGFLGMNFTQVPPLAHLGNVVAAGVLAAWLLSITFLPALAVVLPTKIREQQEQDHPFFDWLAAFIGRQYKKIIWIGSLITVVFAALLPFNEINDQFSKYFDERVPFRVDTDYASDKLFGPYAIELSIDTGEAGGIATPEFLTNLEAFSDFAKSQPEVVHVTTFTDTMKRLNKNMHGDQQEWYRLPDNRELAAQYLLMYEMSLPYGLDLNNQMDVNKSSIKVTVNTVNLSSAQLLRLEELFQNWFSANASKLEVQQASTSLMFAHIGQRNATSQTKGTAISLLLISIILVVALKSIKIGVISLIPNIAPAAIAFGIWALIDGQVGMSTAVVASMTLGIVVDDTIHFLSKYLRARHEHQLDAVAAIHYALSQVGHALLITTLVLVAGFTMLMISTFKLNADMGFLAVITISIALILDFLLLPALLIAFDRKKYPVTHAYLPEGNANHVEKIGLIKPDVA